MLPVRQTPLNGEKTTDLEGGEGGRVKIRWGPREEGGSLKSAVFFKNMYHRRLKVDVVLTVMRLQIPVIIGSITL